MCNGTTIFFPKEIGSISRVQTRRVKRLKWNKFSSFNPTNFASFPSLVSNNATHLNHYIGIIKWLGKHSDHYSLSVLIDFHTCKYWMAHKFG